jgi:hypothetical protein
MKTQFKYLSFIGTALLIATGSSAAFAQTSRYNSACGYTPENRYCVGSNYQNRSMLNWGMSNDSMQNNRSQSNDSMQNNRSQSNDSMQNNRNQSNDSMQNNRNQSNDSMQNNRSQSNDSMPNNRSR